MTPGRVERGRGLALAAFGGAALVLLAGIGGTRLASEAASVSMLGTQAQCERYSGLPAGFGRQRLAGMLHLAGGRFTPGSNTGYPDEVPTGQVNVGSFWIDRTEVTNAQFLSFVRATGYVSQAEREGATAVFRAPAPGQRASQPNAWWVWTAGANWRHPEGPGSSLAGRENQPVVHVTQADALAYARWLGRDLPTEAEWEFAASAGGQAERIQRGEPRDAQGRPTANFWQGIFPNVNTREDGHAAMAPVGCYAANGYGLHDMIGNAWELTRDRYEGLRQPHANGEPEDALGRPATSLRQGERWVIKGGSFLCAASYCMRYRASARQAQEADIAASHVGFRTVLRGS